MGQPSFWQLVKERIAGIAFDVFLWASGMTNDEYLTMIYDEARREYESEKANNWMMK